MQSVPQLAFWRRNYFFLILAHPVYKMWIIPEPITLELWNKLHFEEKKNGEYMNSMALVRTRTIPTERPPPVDEVSAKSIYHV